MTAAAKTLKTLDPEGRGLRCVESAPLPEIREQLKKIRRSAGPGVGSVLLGELEFPRITQGVLMDSVLAVRIPLYTASAEDKFLLADRASGEGAAEAEKTFLTRRLTARSVGKTLNAGLLAARRAGEAVLLEHGLKLTPGEDVGAVRFQLEWIGGDRVRDVEGRATGEGPEATQDMPHHERVEAAVERASKEYDRTRDEGLPPAGSVRSGSSGRSGESKASRGSAGSKGSSVWGAVLRGERQGKSPSVAQGMATFTKGGRHDAAIEGQLQSVTVWGRDGWLVVRHPFPDDVGASVRHYLLFLQGDPQEHGAWEECVERATDALNLAGVETTDHVQVIAGSEGRGVISTVLYAHVFTRRGTEPGRKVEQLAVKYELPEEEPNEVRAAREELAEAEQLHEFLKQEMNDHEKDLKVKAEERKRLARDMWALYQQVNREVPQDGGVARATQEKLAQIKRIIDMAKVMEGRIVALEEQIKGLQDTMRAARASIDAAAKRVDMCAEVVGKLLSEQPKEEDQGEVFKLRVDRDEMRHTPEYFEARGWRLMTGRGRQKISLMTRDRAAAESARGKGYDVRGLVPGESSASSSRSGRSRDETWDPGEVPSSSKSQTLSTGRPSRASAQSMHRSIDIGRGGSSAASHRCAWVRAPEVEYPPGRSMRPDLLKCMKCGSKADFTCQVGGCGNLSCARCIGEVSMMLEARLASASSEGKDPQTASRHVRFQGGDVDDGLSGVSSIAMVTEDGGGSYVPGTTVRITRVRGGPNTTVQGIFGALGGRVEKRAGVKTESEMMIIGAPGGEWDKRIKSARDVHWKEGQRISEELWARLHPTVARDLYQMMGSGSTPYSRCGWAIALRWRLHLSPTMTGSRYTSS